MYIVYNVHCTSAVKIFFKVNQSQNNQKRILFCIGANTVGKVILLPLMIGLGRVFFFKSRNTIVISWTAG